MCLASSLDDTFACRVIERVGPKHVRGRIAADRKPRKLRSDARTNTVEIIAGKTAALTACCCRLGAHYAGAEPDVREALDRYGHHLGVAFQIADDVLDLLGDEATVGKSLGTDLLKQKATLPLIRLLNRVSARERPELLDLLAASDNHRREALRPWFAPVSTRSNTHGQAEKFARLAADELHLLPPSPALDSLRELTRFVVQRKQ